MGEMFPYGLPPTLERRHYKHYTSQQLYTINLALSWAWIAHYGQMRNFGEEQKDGRVKYLPYITHPIAMTDIAIDEFRVDDVEVILTLIFHDTDEPARIPWLNQSMAVIFGKVIAENNRLLTKTDKNKVRYLKKIAESGKWKVIFSKLVDRLHNMRTLTGASASFQKKQASETRQFFLPLCDDLAKVIPDEHRHVPDRLRDMLHTLCEQYGC